MFRPALLWVQRPPHVWHQQWVRGGDRPAHGRQERTGTTGLFGRGHDQPDVTGALGSLGVPTRGWHLSADGAALSQLPRLLCGAQAGEGSSLQTDAASS